MGQAPLILYSKVLSMVVQTLSFKESESDCSHMLTLTLFGSSDLPLTLHTPAV